MSSPVQSSMCALDDLERQAAAGDLSATAELYARLLPYLFGAARRLAPRQPTAVLEDMVQDAWLKTIAQWAAGGGPSRGVRAYLTTTMRNSRINQVKSSDARTLSLEYNESQGADPTTEDEGTIDSHTIEADYVRRAFESLNPQYRLLLAQSVVAGMKPAEIAHHSGRTAAAVSTQITRAKRRLRRAVLAQYLADGGSECADEAQHLPEVVHDALAEHGATAGVQHQLHCERCRANWARFGAVSSTLGLLPLLWIGTRGLMPASAGAMTSSGETETRPDAQTSAEPPALAVSTMAVASSQTGERLAVSKAARVRRVLASKTTLGAGLLILVAGVAVAVAGQFGVFREQSSSPSSGQLPAAIESSDQVSITAMWASQAAGAAIEVSIDAISDAAVNVDHLTVTVPGGVVVDAPTGWECGGVETEDQSDAPVPQLVCAPPLAGAVEEFTVGVQMPTGETSTQIRLDLALTVDDNGEQRSASGWVQGMVGDQTSEG